MTTNPDEALDLTLLDNILNQLLPGNNCDCSLSPSLKVQKQLTEADELLSAIAPFFTSPSWKQINRGLLQYPLFCILCLSSVCNHIAELYDPHVITGTEKVYQIWNDTKLAEFAREREEAALQFGLLN